ncbi:MULTISPECIES: hypothetical protein [unclassified Streptomyces]|nr:MULTISPECIES: hypothetical protein [unclassified Streptomyces]
MPMDPYAVLRALLRAEAARNAPKAERKQHSRPQQQPPKESGR